jgi:hypothetical protein
MIRTSSTKRRCKILMVLNTFILEIFPSAWPDLRSRLRDSIAKMNRRGERGQPYLNPLPIRKKVVDSPLTKMARFALTTQPIIHLIILWLKPV